MTRTKLYDLFSYMPDPRLNRNKKHNLTDILVLSVLAVLCGAESWNAIQLFGTTKIEFLKQILYLPEGIPSHGKIKRVFHYSNPISLRLFLCVGSIHSGTKLYSMMLLL
ncbi:MAG: transposase family protein [Bacteroidota bacterium]